MEFLSKIWLKSWSEVLLYTSDRSAKCVGFENQSAEVSNEV